MRDMSPGCPGVLPRLGGGLMNLKRRIDLHQHIVAPAYAEFLRTFEADLPSTRRAVARTSETSSRPVAQTERSARGVGGVPQQRRKALAEMETTTWI